MATVTQESIHSLLVPMWRNPLLIPDTAVAEVIGFSVPETESAAPWHLGDIFWRGLRLPLLTIETELPSVEDIGRRARIGILNSASGNEDVPFMAILINGIPRLQNIRAEDLTEVEATEVKEARPRGIKAYAHFGDILVALPDMSEIESMSLEAMD